MVIGLFRKFRLNGTFYMYQPFIGYFIGFLAVKLKTQVLAWKDGLELTRNGLNGRNNHLLRQGFFYFSKHL